ncbi:MAG: ATP-binding protein [Lachnospiraceae bacterium]
MKAITETMIREELKSSKQNIYYVPEGKILTPSARDYLQQCKIKMEAAAGKPEHMTHLHGNVLVNKNHPRICFRGKLDSLQALVVLIQCRIVEGGTCKKLPGYLQDILEILREIMRCDVLDEPFEAKTMIGFTYAELRERSHDPVKYYNIQQMVLPESGFGIEYGMLNRLRTEVRETEIAAAQAFCEGNELTRGDILQALNRLSSAVHILMCMYLGGILDDDKPN